VVKGNSEKYEVRILNAESAFSRFRQYRERDVNGTEREAPQDVDF